MIGLKGLRISHFRNFGEDLSPPLVFGKLNAFVGANNSGKSNVLRFIRDVVIPVVNRRPQSEILDSGINESRLIGTGSSSIWVGFSAGDDVIRQSFPHLSPLQCEEFLRNLRILFAAGLDDNLLFIPILKRSNNNTEIDYNALDYSAVDQRMFLTVWSGMGRNGGAFLQNWLPETLEMLYRSLKISVNSVYIPAFRQIDTRLSDFTNEYKAHTGDTNIIDQLAEFASPTYLEHHKRKSFDLLRDFIAEILEVNNVRIDIPHDRKTINIDTSGYYLPLETFGAGVHELVMLASRILLSQGNVVLLEEPEVHLHPQLQRKLIAFIAEKVEGQFFLSTHSSAIIDADGVSVFGVKLGESGSTVEPLLRDQRQRVFFHDLGYKPSELLQSNCVIWVEGPSDRLYLLHWIGITGSNLREGIDFSIVFYGGRLLSHLSASEETETNELIDILAVNRFAAVVIDSDRGADAQFLNATKTRVIDEIEKAGGFTWVTAGREIENYVPSDVRLSSIKSVYPDAVALSGGQNRYGKPLEHSRTDGEKRITVDKLRIARAVSEKQTDLTGLDLESRVSDLIAFIGQSSGR